MIAVVDFGMGNLRSVAKAVEHVAGKASVVIATTAAQVDAAERVVFPGQGAMPDCMQHLRDCGMEEAVRRAAACKPLLAVCIGEQMLFDASEETRVPGRPTPGLGLFRGQVLRFRDADLAQPGGRRLKVPHMGWNRVRQVRRHPLWRGVDDGSWFYFVHSYHAVPARREDVWLESDYGGRFCAAIRRGNLVATQFHPEKSQDAGMKLLKAFASL